MLTELLLVEIVTLPFISTKGEVQSNEKKLYVEKYNVLNALFLAVWATDAHRFYWLSGSFLNLEWFWFKRKFQLAGNESDDTLTDFDLCWLSPIKDATLTKIKWFSQTTSKRFL